MYLEKSPRRTNEYETEKKPRSEDRTKLHIATDRRLTTYNAYEDDEDHVYDDDRKWTARVGRGVSLISSGAWCNVSGLRRYLRAANLVNRTTPALVGDNQFDLFTLAIEIRIGVNLWCDSGQTTVVADS